MHGNIYNATPIQCSRTEPLLFHHDLFASNYQAYTAPSPCRPQAVNDKKYVKLVLAKRDQLEENRGDRHLFPKIIIVTVWYPGPSATPPVKTSFQKVTLRPGFPRDKFPKQSWNHAAFRRQQLLGSNIEAQILS